MKNKKEIEKMEPQVSGEKLITRKAAIRKGAFIAASAATMMVLMSSPAKADASSHPAHPSDPPNGNGNGKGPKWK